MNPMRGGTIQQEAEVLVIHSRDYVMRQNTKGNAGYLSDQPQRSSSFWTFEYYQQYFDVDTNTVSVIYVLLAQV